MAVAATMAMQPFNCRIFALNMNTNCCRNSKPQINHGDWQKERASRLHLQFRRVETARQNGKSLKAALKRFSWYWRGERYRSDNSKQVRLSLSTLRRLYYVWVRDGKKPESIALRYVPHRKAKPSAVQVSRFLDCCRISATLSGAYQLSALPLKASYFFRSVSADHRTVARQIVKANRNHRSALRCFAASRVNLERRQTR